MDTLAAFGLFSVIAMLVCYALEDRSAWFIFGFAIACVLGVGLRFSARGMALRSGRSYLVACRASPMAK
jgi:hypothetical protein